MDIRKGETEQRDGQHSKFCEFSLSHSVLITHTGNVHPAAARTAHAALCSVSQRPDHLLSGVKWSSV